MRRLAPPRRLLVSAASALRMLTVAMLRSLTSVIRLPLTDAPVAMIVPSAEIVNVTSESVLYPSGVRVSRSVYTTPVLSMPRSQWFVSVQLSTTLPSGSVSVNSAPITALPEVSTCVNST